MPLGPTPRTRSAPVARISHAALRANIATLGLSRGTVVSMPADAYGHGLPAISGILADAGLAVTEADSTSPHADALLGFAPGYRPVMRLAGTVLTVKTLLDGEGVSYGYTHRAQADTRIALVVGGYAQGIVRALGNRVQVAIAGERHPIVGRVAMDVCVIDIGGASVSRGDDVVFFGDPDAGEPSLAHWADATGLTARELATTVGLRAVREYRA